MRLAASSGDKPVSNIIKVTPNKIQIPARHLNIVVDSIIKKKKKERDREKRISGWTNTTSSIKLTISKYIEWFNIT